jgi:hypothetical protein
MSREGAVVCRVRIESARTRHLAQTEDAGRVAERRRAQPTVAVRTPEPGVVEEEVVWRGLAGETRVGLGASDGLGSFRSRNVDDVEPGSGRLRDVRDMSDRADLGFGRAHPAVVGSARRHWTGRLRPAQDTLVLGVDEQASASRRKALGDFGQPGVRRKKAAFDVGGIELERAPARFQVSKDLRPISRAESRRRQVPEIVTEGPPEGAGFGPLDGRRQSLPGPLRDESSQRRDPRGSRRAARARPSVRQAEAFDHVVNMNVQVDEARQHVASGGIHRVGSAIQSTTVSHGFDLLAIDQQVAGHDPAARINRAAADENFHLPVFQQVSRQRREIRFHGFGHA